MTAGMVRANPEAERRCAAARSEVSRAHWGLTRALCNKTGADIIRGPVPVCRMSQPRPLDAFVLVHRVDLSARRRFAASIRVTRRGRRALGEPNREKGDPNMITRSVKSEVRVP